MPVGSPPYWGVGFDYYIGLLNERVPDNIGYARLIPTNWWSRFDAPFSNNSTNQTYHVPLLISTCQHHEPVMMDLSTLDCFNGYRSTDFGIMTMTNFQHTVGVGGDSGSPIYLTLDGELCLAAILSSSINFGVIFPTSDSAYTQASINAAMQELSLRNGRTNIYTLSVKDLSNFPVYRQSYDCPP